MVPGVEGDRLPCESNLKQEGDAMDGASRVCAAGGCLAAIGQPAAERGRRAGGRRRRGRGRMMREGGERLGGGRRRRAVVGGHRLLSVTSCGREKRHPKESVRLLKFVRQPSVFCPDSHFSPLKSCEKGFLSLLSISEVERHPENI